MQLLISASDLSSVRFTQRSVQHLDQRFPPALSRPDTELAPEVAGEVAGCPGGESTQLISCFHRSGQQNHRNRDRARAFDVTA